MTARGKADLEARLKRIAGQVAGIQRMVDKDRAVVDVITQVSAIRAALGGVANILLTSHVEDRANEVLATPTPREVREFVSELVQLVQKRDA